MSEQNTIKGVQIRSTTATDCRLKNCVNWVQCAAAGKYSGDVCDPEKRTNFIPDLNIIWKLFDFTLRLSIFCNSFETIREMSIAKNEHQVEINFDGIEHAPRKEG